jgi:hypothetical protein
MIPPFPSNKFNSIKNLCFEAIQKFAPSSLRSACRISAGAMLRPLDAQYQDEFYRACYALLDNKVYLTSGGRVDFQIIHVKWAIECLRDGRSLGEHIRRFQEGGKHYKWIQSGEISDYILLDFRTDMPESPEGVIIPPFTLGSMHANGPDGVPFLYFVIFANDYTNVEIYDAEINLVVNKTRLLESDNY